MTLQEKTAITTWTLDKAHSTIDFQVRHMMISNVRGTFRDFDAVLLIDEQTPANSRVSAAIDVASIDTNEPNRDGHLRSDDFFNAEAFPKITFKSTSVETEDGKTFRITGDLTIRDVTREVVLDGEVEGRIIGPNGAERAGFSAVTEISRGDYNVRWNQALEAGGLALGDRVKVNLHVEAVKQAA